MTTWKRLLALLFALSLVAAACGDSDDEAADGASDDSAATDDSAADDSAADDSASDDSAADDDGMADDSASGELLTDYGVTDTTIRVGLSPDLSGRFAGLTTPLTEAQIVFWEKVNEDGGIAGREVELVIIDNAYDVTKTIENYEVLADESEDGVVMISQVTGSPHNSAIAQDAIADDMVVIPLSWYSGWADQDFGGNHYELYTNYCFESMNGVSFLADQVRANGDEPKLAVIGYPGEYGQDGSVGAKLAAEALGIEVVFDGEGQVPPGEDQTGVISSLVSSGANMVWATTGPADLGAIFGGAVQQGMTAFWSGNSPTFSPALLGTDAGPALDQFYFQSTYSTGWDSNDSEGMQEMIAAMTEARPDDLIQDVYVWGWTEGMFAKAVLEQAAANGDMTRAGVVQAASEVSVDFKGLAPDQNWIGAPNDFVVRESYIYDVSLAALNQIPMSEYAELSDEEKASVGTGVVPFEGYFPFVSEPAANYQFDEPCFISAES